MQQFFDKSTLARVLALLALGFAGYGAYGLSFTHSGTDIRDSAALLLVIAIPLFWGAIALQAEPMPPLEPVAAEDPPRRWYHIAAILVGLLGLFFFAAMNGNDFGLRERFPTNEHIQFALFFVGSLALTWGLSGGFRLNLHTDNRLEIAGVIGVTLLALLLRVPNLERTIPGFVDEVSFTREVPSFESEYDMFLAQPINTVAAFPRLYVYFQWLSTEVFGHDLNGFRLPSAFFGAFTVPALYWLCKHLFGRRDLALIAALLLATFPVHIQFSRVGLNNLGDPFFGVLGFALLVRGARYSGRTNFALAGLAFGFAQYFHEAGRLAFPVLALLWLIWLFLRTRQVTFIRNAVVTLICLVIVGLPLYYTFRSVNFAFAARVNDVGLRSSYWQSFTSLGEVVEGMRLRTANALIRMFHQPEIILYYAGDTPYIHYMLTPFVMLGFAWLLWRFWQPQRTLLLMWVLLPFAGIVILLAEIMSPRTTMFQPALAVFAALGVYYGVRGVLNGYPRTLRWALILLVAGLCTAQTLYYFSSHLPRFTQQMYLLQPWQSFIFGARLLPRDTHIHIVSNPPADQPYLSEVLRFMTNQPLISLNTHTPLDLTPDYLATLSRELPHAFIVRMPDTATDQRLRQTYPDLIGPFLDNEQDRTAIWYAMYLVPPRTNAG